MNVFYLDKDPAKAAAMLCDKHMKMCLETAQILCTVSWHFNVPAQYKPTHRKHPSVLWAMQSYDNWLWLVQHGLAIGKEYTARYGKVHKSAAVIEQCYQHGGKPVVKGFTPPPLCMPDGYKSEDTVQAYRNYYLGDKAKFASWKLPASPPVWFNK